MYITTLESIAANAAEGNETSSGVFQKFMTKKDIGRAGQTSERGSVNHEMTNALVTDEFKRTSSAPSRLKDISMLLRLQDDQNESESAVKSAVMTKSLPNFSDVRSQYNRGIGFLVLSATNEKGMTGYRESSLRIAEFDRLLEGL